MAHPTLAVPEVSESCEFLPGLVDRVLAVYERTVFNHAYRLFPLCSWQSPESYFGACDGGWPCGSRSLVFDLETEQHFCMKHFRQLR